MEENIVVPSSGSASALMRPSFAKALALVGVLLFFVPAQNAAAIHPTAGLAAYYTFDGNADDTSGNANHGTPTNGAALTIDRFGYPDRAYDVDGIDDYITVPDSPSLDLTTAVTFSARFRPSSVPSAGYVLTKSVFLVRAPYSIVVPGGVAICRIDAGDVDYQLASPDPHSETAWTHIACVYDGATLVMYLNGVFTASMPATGILFDNTEPLSIGCDVPMNCFNGKIDDVAIYDRVLTPVEIRALASPIPVTVPALGPLGLLSLSALLGLSVLLRSGVGARMQVSTS